MDHGSYTVGWICALPTELAASEAMLDETHASLPQESRDENSYTLGRIGNHNVAMVCLPSGDTGITSTARVAEHVRSTFPSIKFGLMVGVGGGSPNAENDIRLGDVVVSKPADTFGGVVQYDFGKTIQDGQFRRTGSLNKPPSVLLSPVSRLQARHMTGRAKLSTHLSSMRIPDPELRKVFEYQGVQQDCLFEADYDHQAGNSTCNDCDINRLINRPKRKSECPAIHYGLIASANQVMRHGVTRDKLSRELNVLCFEMEAAGLMNSFPCLVIRGICDYADTHKNKRWQPYAAAAAAAYAKELLHNIPKIKAPEWSPEAQMARRQDASGHMKQTVGPIASGNFGLRGFIDFFRSKPRITEGALIDVKSYINSYSHFDYGKQFETKANERCLGTCEWLENNATFDAWSKDEPYSFFWMTGGVGVGKSILMTHAVDLLKARSKASLPIRRAVIFSFCHSQLNRTASEVLSILLHQLLSQFPKLAELSYKHYRVERTKEKKSASRLWLHIVDIVNQSNLKTVTIVIDGLDECESGSQNEILDLLSKKTPQMKIFVSSRHNECLRTKLFKLQRSSSNVYRHLDLDDVKALINDDIGTFVNGELSRIAEIRGLTREQTSQILDQVQEEGAVFLFANLLIRRLEVTETTNLDSVLVGSPTKLDGLYERLLKEIPLHIRERPSAVLRHLMFACRPLSVAELAFACDYRSNLIRSSDFGQVSPFLPYRSDELIGFRKDLLLYGPLLRHRRDDDSVDFVHLSAKLFLIRLSKSSPVDHPCLSSPQRAQRELASSCIRVMLLNSALNFPFIFDNCWTAKLTKIYEAHHLLSYAMQYWSHHAREYIASIADLSMDSGFVSLLHRLDASHRDPNRQNFWRLLLWSYQDNGFLEDDGLTRRSSSVEFFSAFGLSAMVSKFSSGTDKNEMVIRSSRLGFSSALDSANLGRSGSGFSSALHMAIRGGHCSTASFLLEHFQLSSLEGPVYDSIIEDAALSGTQDLMRQLLGRRRRNPKDVARATNAACATRNMEVLEVLGEEVGSFTDSDNRGRIPLHYLLEDRGHSRHSLLQAALFLISQGNNAQARDNFGNTPLHLLYWSGRSDDISLLTESLVEAGASLFVQNICGIIPLHLAARFASPETVETMLRCGGSWMVGCASKGKLTALHWITEGSVIESRRWPEVIRTLLVNGADPHARTRKGRAALDVSLMDTYVLADVQNVYTRLEGWDTHNLNLLEAPPDDEQPYSSSEEIVQP